MTIDFDIPTVLALMAINLLITSAVLLIVQRHYRTTVRGVAAWSGANLLAVSGLLCVLAGGHVPEFLSMPLGSALFPAAGVLYFKALKQFRGEPVSTRAGWLVVALTFIALTYWQLVDDWPLARLVVFSVSVSGFACACAWAALKRPPRHPGFAERFTGVLFLLQAVFNLARIPDYFIELESGLATSPTAFSKALLGLSEIGMALLSFGFVLMIADKLISELHHLASRDTLTGLLNRRAFIAAAEGEFVRSRRRARPLSLLMLDLDHFKAINDQYGHAAGDELLRTVAAAVTPCLRDYDIFARFGGEEFVVLLPDTSHEEAMSVAERLRSAVECNRAWFEGRAIACTLSVGMALLKSEHRDLDALIRDADLALYRAKSGGRNRVVCAIDRAVAREPAERRRAAPLQ